MGSYLLHPHRGRIRRYQERALAEARRRLENNFFGGTGRNGPAYFRQRPANRILQVRVDSDLCFLIQS